MKRRIGIGVAVLVGLVGLAVAAVLVLVKPERMKEEALTRIRASTGYEIQAGPASLAFGWSGAGVSVRDVHAVAPDSSLELSVSRVSTFAKVFPLLQRRVELTRIVLESPEYVMRSKPASREGAPRGSSSSGAFAFLGVESWSIQDGSFRQIGPGGELVLQDLDWSGSFRFDRERGGEGSATGTLGGGRFVGPAGTWPFPAGTAEASFRVTPAMDSVAVSGLRLVSGAVEAVFSGGYARTAGGWGGELGGSIEPVSWAEVSPLLPAALSDSLRRVTLGGTLALPEMRLRQVPGGPSEVSGMLTLEDLSAKFSNAPVGLSGFDGTLHFTRDTLTLKGGKGDLDGTPFTLDLEVTGNNPRRSVAHVVTSVPGTTLGRLLPAGAGLSLSAGRMDVDLTATSILPGPKIPELRGRIDLTGFTGSYRDLPLTQGRGTFRFSGSSAEIADLGMTLGRSDLTMRATVPQLAQPWASFHLNSNVLDLDQLMPPKTSKSAPTAPGPVIGLPGEGRVEIGTLRTKGQDLRAVRAHARLDREGLRLTDVSGKLHGGDVTGSLAMSPETGGQVWTYEGDLRATGVSVGAVLAQWIPGAHLLDGTLEGDMDLSGRAGGEVDPRRAMSLIGDVRLVDGAFLNLPALSTLGQYLKLPATEEGRWAFKSLTTHIVMREGAVELKDLHLAQLGLDWAVSGRIGVAGELGLAGTLRAEPGRLKLPDQIAFLTPYLADTDGRVPLDFKLEGPATSPRVTLDWDTATQRAAERLEAKESEKAKKAIEEKVTDPETLKKLENLLGGKKSGGG